LLAAPILICIKDAKLRTKFSDEIRPQTSQAKLVLLETQHRTITQHGARANPQHIARLWKQRSAMNRQQHDSSRPSPQDKLVNEEVIGKHIKL
jgi:hypothetical protein